MESRKMTVRYGAQILYRRYGEWRERRADEALWLERRRDPAGIGPVDIVFFYGDEPTNLYQARQWLGPLAELNKGHRVAIVCQNVASALELERSTDLDIFYSRAITGIQAFFAERDVKLVLYPSNFMGNMAIFQFADALHVFVNHGESDKKYMVSGHLRAYDYVMVAGQAAEDRLRHSMINFSVPDRTRRIGRPQIEAPMSPPGDWQDSDRITVLYAPTWEGDTPATRYGSVSSHGLAILSSLLADRRFRVIVRIHPRSGMSDPTYGEDVEVARQLIETANGQDPTAHHYWDTTGGFDWQLDVADVMVCDVSAVAIDWLPTLKPLYVTQPVEVGSKPTDGVLSHLPLLQAQDAPQMSGLIADALSGGGMADVLRPWADRYFGSDDGLTHMERFLGVMDDLVAERDQRVAVRDRDGDRDRAGAVPLVDSRTGADGEAQ